MADVMFPALAVALFGLPAALGVVVVVRRRRDRPVAWTVGWLCTATIGLTFAAGSVAVLAGPRVASAILCVGLVAAASLGAAWFLARAQMWCSGRTMKRLAAEQGHPIPRGKLTAPVLVILYLAAMMASIVAAACLWAYAGARWMGVEFTVAGMPLMVGVVPAVLLSAACALHVMLRALAPLGRELWDAWLHLGRRGGQ